VAYRSFSPSKFEARGARKVTTGMGGVRGIVYSSLTYPHAIAEFSLVILVKADSSEISFKSNLKMSDTEEFESQVEIPFMQHSSFSTNEAGSSFKTMDDENSQLSLEWGAGGDSIIRSESSVS